MEFLVPLLLYLGYSLFVSFFKRQQNEYQEPDLTPETTKGNLEPEQQSEEQQSKEQQPEEQQPEEQNKFRRRQELTREAQARKEKAAKKKAEARQKLQEVKQKQRRVKEDTKQGLNFKKLTPGQLQQGILLTEILDAPRAKRPYRSPLNKK